MADLRAVWVVWLQGVRLLLRTKKTVFLSLLALGFVGIEVLVVAQASRHTAAGELYGRMLIAGLFMGIIPFATMFFSVAALADEITDRTFVYLFVRPVRKWAVLLGKYLAAATVSGGYAVAVVLVSHLLFTVPDWSWRAGRGLRPDMLPAMLALAATAAGVYAAIGILCAAVLRRPFLAAMLFVVVLEGAVGNTPPQAGIRSLTVIDGIRAAMVAWVPADPGLREFFREWSQEPRDDGSGVPAETMRELQARRAPRHLATMTLVSLLIATYVFSRREYESRPKE
jgi:ABC-type transport system involved in multi-copper enzyme maturation permease subunit